MEHRLSMLFHREPPSPFPGKLLRYEPVTNSVSEKKLQPLAEA